MAMDKPRVEATEQMAQNCMDILQSKNQREHKITVCIVVILLFQFYFTPEDPMQVEGTYM